MLVLRAVRRLAVGVLVFWIAGCILAFFSGAFFTLLPIPWGLPLPWSDFEDFVETPDGRVFVTSRFYSRVLCYDRSGNFLDAHCFPRRARATRLAVGRDGLVHCESRN